MRPGWRAEAARGSVFGPTTPPRPRTPRAWPAPPERMERRGDSVGKRKEAERRRGHENGDVRDPDEQPDPRAAADHLPQVGRVREADRHRDAMPEHGVGHSLR